MVNPIGPEEDISLEAVWFAASGNALHVAGFAIQTI